jgi:hypothetical protein
MYCPTTTIDQLRPWDRRRRDEVVQGIHVLSFLAARGQRRKATGSDQVMSGKAARSRRTVSHS